VRLLQHYIRHESRARVTVTWTNQCPDAPPPPWVGRFLWPPPRVFIKHPWNKLLVLYAILILIAGTLAVLVVCRFRQHRARVRQSEVQRTHDCGCGHWGGGGAVQGGRSCAGVAPRRHVAHDWLPTQSPGARR
jgi:hypothetical protein